MKMVKHIPDKKWKELFKLVPRLVSDGVLIHRGKIILVKRAHEPFRGYWCLPGGFVNKGEPVKKACEREIYEETGLRARAVKLINVYDNSRRDPRGHLVSVVYLLAYKSGKIKVSHESSDVRFFPIDKLPRLPSDHMKMIKDALKTLGNNKLQ